MPKPEFINVSASFLKDDLTRLDRLVEMECARTGGQMTRVGLLRDALRIFLTAKGV